MTNKEGQKKPIKKRIDCLNIGCGINPIPCNETERWFNLDMLDLKEYINNDERFKDKMVIFSQVNVDMEYPQISNLYRQNRFDKVLMADVIEHLYYPLGVMKDVWRACKHGAEIIINVPYQGSKVAWSDFGHLREVNEIMLMSLTEEFIESNIKQHTKFTPYFIDDRYNFKFNYLSHTFITNQSGEVTMLRFIIKANKK